MGEEPSTDVSAPGFNFRKGITMECFNDVSREEQLDRLDKLEAQILNAGPEHYSQRNWFHNGATGRGQAIASAASVDINACGTSACLAGHGALALVATAKAQGVSFKSFVFDVFDTELPWFTDAHIACYYGLSTFMFAGMPSSGWSLVRFRDGTTMLDKYHEHVAANRSDDDDDDVDIIEAQANAEWHTALDWIADRKKFISDGGLDDESDDESDDDGESGDLDYHEGEWA